MELYLKNIGIIKDATVNIEGLTVITGKNSAGKTTVGKTLYSIIRANCHAQESYESSREEYLYSQMEKLRRLLSPTNYTIVNGQYAKLKEKRNAGDAIALLFSRSYRTRESQEMYQLLNGIYQSLDELTADTILNLIGKTTDPDELLDSRNKRYQEQFEDIKQVASQICRQTIETLESNSAYRTYLHQRTEDYLNYDFHDQIKPVKNSRGISQIIIRVNGSHECINLKIRSKNRFDFDQNSSFVFPFSEAVFIDDPFVLDRLEAYDKVLDRQEHSYKGRTDNYIHPSDLVSHRVDLLEKIISKRSSNFFDEIETQKTNRVLFEKINEIVPGEFQETQDGLFYNDQGVKLSIYNLATGSKQFFIIKQLLLNGYIGKDSLLVLDEPESHLHPEWITKFAEIIILLVKELNIRIVLTTHSPDLLLALKVLSKEYKIEDKSHYYLAKRINNDWAAEISNIDDNINEGYAHLSIPLLEMNVRDRQHS